MTIPAIQTRMRAAFPATTDLMTVRTVREGIMLSDDLIRNTPLLSTLIGQDYRGLIRRAGVMFAFHEACTRGDLPFRTTVRRMHRGHWHLLDIASGVERAQICRSAEPDAFPDDTPVKQDERLANQFDLFQEHPPIEELLSRIPRLYVWLTFGVDAAGNITHVCWGAPAREEMQWLAYENILRRAGEGGSPIEPALPPTPDPTRRLRFKEHIEEAIEKKNDDEKSA